MMCLFALRELNAFTSVTSVVIFLTSLDGFGCAWINKCKKGFLRLSGLIEVPSDPVWCLSVVNSEKPHFTPVI